MSIIFELDAIIMQNKMINFLFISIFCYILSACGGGGSSFTQVDSTQAIFTTSDQTIDENMQPINTTGDISIQMINTGKNTLNIQSIAIDNDLDFVESSSSCISKNLAPSEQCTITVNINGVYTSSTNVNLMINTNNTQLKQTIKVFNYDYTHNLPDAQKIQVDALTDNSHRYDSSIQSYSITDKPDENIITITNKESSSLAIENIIFEPESIEAYPNNLFNKVIPEKSSCIIGTKLLSNQSCDIVIFNMAVATDGRYYRDKLKFKFAGIDTLNVITILETIDISKAFSTVNCNKINDCPVKFNALGYKAVLDRLTIMYYPKGAIVDTNASEYPCISGADFTTTGYCNLNISIEDGATVTDDEIWLDLYVKVYIDDSNYVVMHDSNPH